MTDGTDFNWDTVEADPAESNVMPKAPGTARTTAGATRRGRTGVKRLSLLKEALASQMFQAGAMIGFGFPVTGYYIAQESEQFSSAIVDLAGKKAEWIEALENVAKIGPGLIVGRTVLGIGCALGTDRYHRTNGESGISPDKRAAMLLGVAAAYYEVYKDELSDAPASDGFVPPPHGTFVPVS